MVRVQIHSSLLVPAQIHRFGTIIKLLVTWNWKKRPFISSNSAF